MTYVITEPCIGVKDASCVDVCPVDCIHATDDDAHVLHRPRRVHRLRRLRAGVPGDRDLRRGRRAGRPGQKYIQINADYFKK